MERNWRVTAWSWTNQSYTSPPHVYMVNRVLYQEGGISHYNLSNKYIVKIYNINSEIPKIIIIRWWSPYHSPGDIIRTTESMTADRKKKNFFLCKPSYKLHHLLNKIPIDYPESGRSIHQKKNKKKIGLCSRYIWKRKRPRKRKDIE
jgi:hypothetical protein